MDGYGSGDSAPLINGFDQGAEYLCADNVLKTHAEVYHLYRSNYSRPDGKIGITLSCGFYYPAKPSGDVAEDGVLVDLALQYQVITHLTGRQILMILLNLLQVTFKPFVLPQLGLFAHSLFSRSGYYPPVIVETVLANSMREGRRWSRLPQWSEYWRNRVQGSADFLGINYYTSHLVEKANPSKRPVEWGQGASILNDLNLIETSNSSWVRAKSSWLYSVPSGIGDLMR